MGHSVVGRRAVVHNRTYHLKVYMQINFNLKKKVARLINSSSIGLVGCKYCKWKIEYREGEMKNFSN